MLSLLLLSVLFLLVVLLFCWRSPWYNAQHDVQRRSTPRHFKWKNRALILLLSSRSSIEAIQSVDTGRALTPTECKNASVQPTVPTALFFIYYCTGPGIPQCIRRNSSKCDFSFESALRLSGSLLYIAPWWEGYLDVITRVFREADLCPFVVVADNILCQ